MGSRTHWFISVPTNTQLSKTTVRRAGPREGPGQPQVLFWLFPFLARSGLGTIPTAWALGSQRQTACVGIRWACSVVKGSTVHQRESKQPSGVTGPRPRPSPRALSQELWNGATVSEFPPPSLTFVCLRFPTLRALPGAPGNWWPFWWLSRGCDGLVT